MKSEDPAPHIEGIMSVVREQEWMVDPAHDVRKSVENLEAESGSVRELVHRDGHSGGGDASEGNVSENGGSLD